MVKKVNIILVVMMLPFLLTGCWDQRAVDKRAYVYGIGMDVSKEENKFKITYLIINPEYGSEATGGTTNESPHELISFDTNDLMTSKNLANAVVAKEITYDLLRVFFISEKLAKNKEFIRWLYDATKDREIRRDSYFIVTKESPLEFLEKNKPKLETRMDQYFNLILKRGVENGMLPDSDLHRYFKITEADADLFLAAYGTTEDKKEENKKEEDQIFAGEFETEGDTNPTQFLGSAVFKEGKMIGKINGEETRISILLNDTLNMKDVLTTYPDPFNKKYRVAARVVKKQKNDVKMTLRNGTGQIDVTVPLYVEILSDHSMVSYGEDEKKRAYLKHYIEKKLEAKMEEFVDKTQKKLKGEPFGWSLIARKKFQTLPEYKKFDWMNTYPNMKVNIKVKIRFGEFGRQGKLPKISEVRD